MPEASPSLFRQAAALPRLALAGLIQLYQAAVSPTLHALGGPTCGCRFAPSCSQYALEAVRSRGLLVGAALALWRLARCNPLSSGGLDPVPPRRHTCVRIPA